MEHAGGCHCGNIRLRLRLTKTPQAVEVRACGCSFCRVHGARTVTDPDGLLEVWAKDWSLVCPYRFSLGTADFLVCASCGIYVAAVCPTPSGDRATINVNSLDDRDAFAASPTPVIYETETKDAR